MLTLDPISFYQKALDIARRIKNPEDEYQIMADLGETHEDVSKAIEYYEEAFKIADEILEDPEKRLACWTALIKLHGRGERDAVEKHKNEARRELIKTGKLAVQKLNAWLLDEKNQIPAILIKDNYYRLCLNLGNIPAAYLASPSVSEKSASDNFIFNLSDQRPGICKPEKQGVCLDSEPRLTEGPPGPPREVVGVIGPVTLGTAIAEGTEKIVEPGLTPGTSVPQTPKGVEVYFEPTPDKSAAIPQQEQLEGIEVRVAIAGLGFACEHTPGILQASRQRESDILIFYVIPKELGKNRLDISCEANGIPYSLLISYEVELPKPGASSKEELPKTIDILIGYANEDWERVRPLVVALTSEGWSVSCFKIMGQNVFDWFKDLNVARSILVVWSKNSLKSKMVRKETEKWLRMKLPIFPVLLDAVRLPSEFWDIQAVDFSNWDGSSNSPVFQNLVRAIESILGQPAMLEPIKGNTKFVLTCNKLYLKIALTFSKTVTISCFYDIICL
ncbi:MAG: TIR domain-containing protein [Desulfobacca sp.]|nr:TIR domain-containing protein [Desulfobacca sp.]